MFTETLNSTSKTEKNMEFEYSTEESDNDDDDDDDNDNDCNDGYEFPPLPFDIDLPSYTNPLDPYDNRHHGIDFFYCSSPPFPSPPPLPSSPPPPPTSPPLPPPPPPPSSSSSSLPPTSLATMARIYGNALTISSIRSYDDLNQPIISFATQQKKKVRASIAYLPQNIYVNIPVPPPPLPSRSVKRSNEVTYATLMNTTSIIPPVDSDLTINHVEYQELHIANENNPNRIYQNIKLRRLPQPPYYSESKCSPQSLSLSVTPLENNESSSHPTVINAGVIPSSSAHIYINLQYQDDKPPTIPARTNKSTPHVTQTSLLSILPSTIEQKEDTHSFFSSVATSPIKPEQDEEDINVLETSSTASSAQTIKKLEVNMAPNYDDKKDLYRTKMSIAKTDHIPSFVNARQRRLLHGTRRRRLRGSIALRNSINSRSGTKGITNTHTNRQNYQRSNLNVTVRHPMVTDDRWRRTLRKRRRQRAVQLKLDGNVLYRQKKSIRPTCEHTYNEIKQPISLNNRILNSNHNGTIGVIERAMQFNGALRDRVFSWYRGTNRNESNQRQEITPQVFSTSENIELDLKGTATTDEDDEEEFFTHDTFEDFLLRRRPKSSASTTVSGTSTIISHIDSVSQRLPVREMSHQKSHILPPPPLPPPPQPPPPPPPPPPLPPLPPTPPPVRRFPGLALGLDKTDVDFIHNILQRTRGDHRVWNRITALKEAYIRATSKKHDLPKKTKSTRNQIDENKNKKAMAMKHSLAATKIRAELEKYDELPASSETILDEDDEYDEMRSVNNHCKKNCSPHSRSMPALPQTPSAANRILNFVALVKRRAQNNVQQLQKNLHDIRSRVHTETMGISSNPIAIQRHTSAASRQRQILKDSSNTPRMYRSRFETVSNQNPLLRRTNSHYSTSSTDHINVRHQHQLNRTRSNASQLPQQQYTHRHRQRIQSEKTLRVNDRSPSLITRPLPFERHSSRQTQNEITSRRHRSTNPS